MRIYIYTGGEKLVSKSGVGQAIRHQQEMLRRAGVDTTEHWTADTAAVHVNTVLPDSLLAVLAARIRGRKVVYYGHSTMEDFRSSFKGSDLLAPLFCKWIKFCYGLGDVVLTPHGVLPEAAGELWAEKTGVQHLQRGRHLFLRTQPGEAGGFPPPLGAAGR